MPQSKDFGDFLAELWQRKSFGYENESKEAYYEKMWRYFVERDIRLLKAYDKSTVKNEEHLKEEEHIRRELAQTLEYGKQHNYVL